MDLIEQIVSLINADELEKAREIIDKNEKKYSQNVDFLSAKAMFFIKCAKYRDAINIIKAALEIEPESNDLHYNLAYAYQMMDSSGHSEDIAIKNYPKRISHTKGTTLPTRGQIADSTVETGAPLVSIVVLAYNKVDYTKQCIESIYKYTDDVDYELIVVDNGSTDETLEYFKSLPKRRIVRLEENQGAVGGFNEGLKAAKGRYIAGVCNDFIFTKNWLSNLIKCIESDENIGFVSPASNYISNNQKVILNFSNVEEMHAEAEKFNISNPEKWEERMRLLPNVLFVKKEVFDIIGYYDPAFYYGEFADDDLAFRIRRAGYKLVFCGDTFTYHFGHVTGGVDQRENNSLIVGQELFLKKYNGVNPWTDIKYDSQLIDLLDTANIKKDKKVKILGVDVRCGNTLLMIKNKLKQQGFSDIELNAYVQNPLYYQDLKTICNDVYVGELDKISKIFEKETFDHVIFDEALNTYSNPQELIAEGLALVKPQGQAIMSLINTQDINNLSISLSNNYVENNMIKSAFSIFDLAQCGKKQNLKAINIVNQRHVITEKDNNVINEFARKVCTDNNVDGFAEKLKTQRYLANFIK